MPLPEPRYVVTELRGYADIAPAIRNPPSFWGGEGASFTVLDRHVNHRIMAIYRSEDYSRADNRFARNETRIDYARMLANTVCDQLNDEHYGETP